MNRIERGRKLVLIKLLTFPLSFIHFAFSSCELSQRLFTKYEKLAENINSRDDVKLAHVNCDSDAEFCESHKAKGKQSWTLLTLTFSKQLRFFSAALQFVGLTLFLYPDGKDRVQFKGVKSEEGISRFLVKNLGDSIVVSSFNSRLLIVQSPQIIT